MTTLKDYHRSDVFSIRALDANISRSDRSQVCIEIELAGVCWEDVAKEVAGNDDEWVEAFINRVRELTKDVPF